MFQNQQLFHSKTNLFFLSNFFNRIRLFFQQAIPEQKMLKKLEQLRNDIPVIVPKHSTNPKASQRSSVQSVNSFSNGSIHQIDSKNSKAARSSIANYQKAKSKFQQIKENVPTPTQLIQEKMQNVSCLYSNFIFRNSKKNFIDEVKLQRYRIMLENQRLEKNQLQKDFQDMKIHLAETEKEKSTIMFAYRTLQQKIRQRQKQVRIKMKHMTQMNNASSKHEKLSVNFSNQDQMRGSMTSVFMQPQILRSRKKLTSQGILLMKDEEKISDAEIGQKLKGSASAKDISNIIENSENMKEWEEKLKKFEEMEKQLAQATEIKAKIYWLEVTNKELNEEKTHLLQQIERQKVQANKAISQLSQSKAIVQTLKQQILHLNQKITQLQQSCTQHRTKCEQYQRQDQRKKSIIQDLQNTKYSYLMKEEKEKEQIQALKKFTQNLQLNDEKINQFIQVTFGNKVQVQAGSQNKLFKQDISYILHLIKKKENIYSELIKEYQQKHRQTQTRSYLLEKRLHLTDIFIKKLDTFVDEQIALCETLRNVQSIKKGQTNNNTPSAYVTLNKFIQTLQAHIENYHLDKRII